MTCTELERRITINLPFPPTRQQAQLIEFLSSFCVDSSLQHTVFIVNGYAGTGKTSVTGALVKALGSFKVKCVLLAPTGRAAKVFSSFAGQPAYTIHRYIYRNDMASGRFGTLKENKAKRGTVFIVDESSMIDTVDNEAETLNLLDDLLQFVFSGDECRLIFLGDTAQLPPVSSSPPITLHKALHDRHFHVIKALLTSTVRQSSHSGILYNATWLRRSMEKDPIPLPRLFSDRFDDVSEVSGEELSDELEKSYSTYGIEQTIIITRSNKRAVEYNMAVRNLILDRTAMISKGDMLMVAKNNYFWSNGVKGIEFIANGDMAIVERIISKEKYAEMDFADVELYFPDHDISLTAKINLTCLVSDAPALSRAGMQTLAETCALRNRGNAGMISMADLRNDPYFNALQVKYGYAITCHKAQGGQWDSVFVDVGHVPEDTDRLELFRWLYTATTRAVKEIHFINPNMLVD